MENLSKIPKILGYESIYIQPHFHVLVYSTNLYLILAFLKRCMGKGDLTVDPLPPIVPNTCHVNKNSLPKSHHHSHHPSFDSTSTSPRRCSLNDNLNATLSSRKSVPACTPTKGKQTGVVTGVNSPKSTPSRRLLNTPSSCSSVGVSGHPLPISDAEKCKYNVLAARCLMIFGYTFLSRELIFFGSFPFLTTPPPPPSLVGAYYLQPTPDARAIFLHNGLLCHDTVLCNWGCILGWGHKRKRSIFC